MHVVERAHPGRLPEAALERALGQTGEPDHLCDRRLEAVVRRRPQLAAADQLIGRTPAAGQRCIRERAGLLGVEQVDARDLHRILRRCEPRDQGEHQHVPGDAAAGHHDACIGAGEHQPALRMPARARMVMGEAVAVGPVRRCIAAVEQAGAREQQCTGAGRGQGRAGLPGAAQPGDLGLVQVRRRGIRRNHQVGDADDVGVRTVGERRVRRDPHAVAGGERPAVRADDEGTERRGGRRAAVQHLPVAPRAGQHVVEAVQRRRADLGGAEQRDRDRSGRWTHGRIDRFVARTTVVRDPQYAHTAAHRVRHLDGAERFDEGSPS